MTILLFTSLSNCCMVYWKLIGLVGTNWARGCKGWILLVFPPTATIEESTGKSRVPFTRALVFCNQPGFRNRRNSRKVTSGWGFESSKLSTILCICSFQVFQVIKIVVRRPSESHPTFTVSLNGIVIDHEEVKGEVHMSRTSCVTLVYAEKLLFWDGDQQARHCSCCRGCCLTQLRVWPLESCWGAGRPRKGQSKSRESFNG